ncbi:MAG TPA: hypothetical protein VGJ05_03440 [Fimbriiglobus sp.]|jgi:hypothetical protein
MTNRLSHGIPCRRDVSLADRTVAYGSPAGAASSALDFALTQVFDVSFDKPTVKGAKLTAEARVIGFLRCHKLGSAEQSGAVTVTGGGIPPLSVDLQEVKRKVGKPAVTTTPHPL